MMERRADDICRQMEEVRRTAGAEVESIVQSAKTLSDWRYYIKNHPFVLAGAAAGLGFLLVPRKKAAQGATDDAKELVELLKKHHVRGVTVEGPPRGLVKTAIGIATPFLLRTAMNLVQSRMSSIDWGALYGGKPATQPPSDDGVEQSFEEFNIPR
jgi:hypothetical protein